MCNPPKIHESINHVHTMKTDVHVRDQLAARDHTISSKDPTNNDSSEKYPLYLSAFDSHRTNKSLSFPYQRRSSGTPRVPQVSGIARTSREECSDPRSTFSSLTSSQASEIVDLEIRTGDDSSNPCNQPIHRAHVVKMAGYAADQLL